MELKRFKQYLLTGVSYAIPFVACGGILIALALAFSMTPTGPDPKGNWKMILDIGLAAFALLVPVLAGYIAFGIADRPGLVPGFVGGWIATHLAPMPGHPDQWVSAGFLGGMLAGLIAGFVAFQLKRIKLPAYLKPIMPILVIPVISALVVGVIMYKVVGMPVANAMTSMTVWLDGMQAGSKIILALILGAMIAFDMGGPVNKVAFFFGAAMIQKGNYLPMGACAAAICIPPIGLGLATLLNKKNWTEEEHEAGIASLAMGMIGITEGAIPFAAADPLRVIPTIMVGSMTGAVIAMLMNVGDHAPHGGPIVLPVVDNRGGFVLAILVGAFVVAAIINLLRALGRKNTQETSA
ncbi:MAG TPA: fructose-specific PTS transporter subunit EIIC [Armatimonadota bacterium]|jgi:fructose-specific phosphotransferase system IIC component